jgi:hypothetical protein
MSTSGRQDLNDLPQVDNPELGELAFDFPHHHGLITGTGPEIDLRSGKPADDGGTWLKDRATVPFPLQGVGLNPIASDRFDHAFQRQDTDPDPEGVIPLTPEGGENKGQAQQQGAWSSYLYIQNMHVSLRYIKVVKPPQAKAVR